MKLSPKKTSRAAAPVLPPVRLGIIGTGGMANHHAKSFKTIPGCEIVAAADIDAARVRGFCDAHGIPESYTSANEMLTHARLDAVTIVTPDPYHAPLSILCLNAGKHVLCEKPLALTYPEAKRMVAAARKAGKVHMVNLSYRNWPCIQAVATLVQSGGIGEVRHVEASYLQSWLPSKVWGDWRTSPQWLWRLSKRHGSNGALGDVGVHILDFASFPAGPISQVFCRLKAFPKAPRNRVGEYVLDANDSAVMTVEFKNGALGTIHTTRWSGGHANRLFLKISGTTGSVEIDSERTTTGYRLSTGAELDAAKWTDVEATPTPTNFERFIRCIQTDTRDQPDFVRGAEVQKVLDACFASDEQGLPVKV